MNIVKRILNTNVQNFGDARRSARYTVAMANDEHADQELLDTEKIRTLREAMGLTQEKAAVKAGFKGRAAWSNFESGRQTAITLGTLAKLALVLEVEARDLLKPGPFPAARRRFGIKGEAEDEAMSRSVGAALDRRGPSR